MIGFWRGAQIGNIVMETPRLELVNSYIEEVFNKQIEFWRGAQTRKHGPGDAYAQIVSFIKEFI